jgi:hypothetical protein
MYARFEEVITTHEHLLQAFNARDLDAIMKQFAADCVSHGSMNS